MLSWIQLNDTSQLDDLVEGSFNSPCIIYKHSTRCSLSSIAKMRLEQEDHLLQDIPAFLLYVVENRILSNLVSERFDVYHESPQILLIEKGECTLESSHLDIHAAEIGDYLSIHSCK